MKNIFTTIEYVAEKIKEAITGHKNDEQAHPNLSKQINVLSTGKSDKLEVIKNRIDNNEVRFDSGVVGFNYSEEATDNLPPQAYIKQEISQRVGRSVEIATGVLNNFGYSPIMLFRTSHDSGISDWQQLATTTKTDILVAPNPGYTITFNNSCKINNIAYINVRVKKTDGSEFISGAQVTPFTLPLTAGGETNGNGNGESGGFWRVPATVLFTGNTVVVNPTSNCTQIHITGAIVL